MNHTRIAIIGAGMAGLSCATALQQQGFDVQVFDKSRGPSGRMSTRRGEGWQCDHGAQYFTARHPEFRAEVGRWMDAGAAALWTPKLHIFGPPRPPSEDTHIERFVGTPGMTAPARLMAASLPLKLETTVQKLQRTGPGWQLFSLEHGWLDDTFDAVLLAVPAPQVVPLMQPVAPHLAQLATDTPMRGSWSLMLRYDAPLALPFDAAFVNEGPLRWVCRDNSKPGRNGLETWLLHATGEWSDTHIEAEADWVKDELLGAFSALGGSTPAAWSAHRWRYSDTDARLGHGCVWQPEQRLGLCGDWLNGGKVEGAWLSGQALARQFGDTPTA